MPHAWSSSHSCATRRFSSDFSFLGCFPYLPDVAIFWVSERPRNGFIGPYQNTTEGAEISFRCNSQFVPSTAMIAICGADARWNPDPATHVCMCECLWHTWWITCYRLCIAISTLKKMANMELVVLVACANIGLVCEKLPYSYHRDRCSKRQTAHTSLFPLGVYVSCLRHCSSLLTFRCYNNYYLWN